MGFLYVSWRSAKQDEKAASWNTISTCCLVCHNWRKECSNYLAKHICLRSRGQLTDILSLYSHTYPQIPTMTLTVYVKNEQLLHLSFLQSFSTRLSRLTDLDLVGHGVNSMKELPFFSFPRPLPMHLNQLHALTSLRLKQLRLRSFGDLRRCVVSVPSLESLELRFVQWPPLDSSSLPLAQTARSLSYVLITHTSPCKDIFWLWAAKGHPSPTHPVISHLGGKTPVRHPILLSDDVASLSRIIQDMNATRGSTSFRFRWINNPSTHSCRIIVS